MRPYPSRKLSPDTITLEFSTTKGSGKIRFLTRSEFSHCDIDLGYGLLGASNTPNAIIFEGNKNGNGVCVRNYKYQVFQRRHQAVIRTPLAPYILEKARSQIGKPFDNKALYATFLPWIRDRTWFDPSMWYCAELVLWAFDGEHGPERRRFFNYELLIERNVVVPEDLVLILAPYMDTARFKVNLV